MYFQPSRRRPAGHHLRQVPKAEPYPRQLKRVGYGHSDGDRLTSCGLLFGCLTAADNALAISFGNIDPCLWISIHLLGSSARIVSCGGTVILAGLGDAVALLGLKAGRL